MVPNYTLIANGDLRMLVIASESINSLPAEQIVQMIEQIAKLSPEGVEQMIKILEDEQRKIQEAKRAKGITPEMEKKKYEEKRAKLHHILKTYDGKIRIYQEEESREKDFEAAEASLRNL